MLSEPSSHLRNMPIRSRGFQFVSSSTIAWSIASRRLLLNGMLTIYDG